MLNPLPFSQQRFLFILSQYQKKVNRARDSNSAENALPLRCFFLQSLDFAKACDIITVTKEKKTVLMIKAETNMLSGTGAYEINAKESDH